MMYLLVTAYSSANTAFEDGGTARKVLIFSSRVVSRRIKQALALLTLVTSQLRPFDFQIIWIGTLAPFIEIHIPFGPIHEENDMRGSGASSVHL